MTVDGGRAGHPPTALAPDAGRRRAHTARVGRGIVALAQWQRLPNPPATATEVECVQIGCVCRVSCSRYLSGHGHLTTRDSDSVAERSTPSRFRGNPPAVSHGQDGRGAGRGPVEHLWQTLQYFGWALTTSHLCFT